MSIQADFRKKLQTEDEMSITDVSTLRVKQNFLIKVTNLNGPLITEKNLLFPM